MFILLGEIPAKDEEIAVVILDSALSGGGAWKARVAYVGSRITTATGDPATIVGLEDLGPLTPGNVRDPRDAALRTGLPVHRGFKH